MQFDLFVEKPNWIPPKEFVNFKDAPRIALDIETYDPNLKEKGPGVYRKDGHICGVAIAIDETPHSHYYPFGHEMGEQFQKENVIGWLKEQLNDYKGEIVGANLMYDLDWLQSYGVWPEHAKILDVQMAEPLIDENALRYNLDSLAEKYLGESKVEGTLEEAIRRFFPKGTHAKSNIWRLPPEYVGAYAEGDVNLPLRILKEQEKLLEKDNLLDLFAMERRLVPLLLRMRQRGVPVDLEGAQELREELLQRQETSQNRLNELSGREVCVDSNEDLARIFDIYNIPYPRTEKGNPSFQKEWLEKQEHEAAHLIREVRRYSKIRGTFIDGYIFGLNVDGVLHGEFHPLRSDDAGTVSGRFSSSHPNLQNLPSRDPEFGKRVRGLFKPEPDCFWAKLDWSQIEYRLIVHYAVVLGLPGAAEAQELYLKDANTDFHQAVAEMTGLERRRAKDCNFGMAYGARAKKIAFMMGVDVDVAQEILEQYNEHAPFVSKLNERAQDEAKARGYIRTFLNRRRRFDTWEKNGELSKEYKPGSKRAFTHKALNSIIQGSAADIMKQSMVDFYESGVYQVLGAPHLTVHDELDFSVPHTKEGKEAIVEMKNIMENCLKFKVPILCDMEVGESWGQVEEWTGW